MSDFLPTLPEEFAEICRVLEKVGFGWSSRWLDFPPKRAKFKLVLDTDERRLIAVAYGPNPRTAARLAIQRWEQDHQPIVWEDAPDA